MKESRVNLDENRIHGFDRLKIFFAIAIVAWHSKVFGATDFFSIALPMAPRLVDIIYGNIFLVGVPVFFLMSFYLYISGRRDGYFLKRFLNLLIIYVFWNLVAVVIFNNQETISSIYSYQFWLRGGYGHLWFIYTLIFLTVFTEILLIIKNRINNSYFISICLLLLISSVSLMLLKPLLVPRLSEGFKNLLPFLGSFDYLCYALIPLIWLSLNKNIQEKIVKNKKLIFVALLLIFSGSIIFEYLVFAKLPQLEGQVIFFPTMSRLSVLVSSILIFFSALGVKKEISPNLKWIAPLTTGVFLIHFYLLEIMVYKYPIYFDFFELHRIMLFILVLTTSAFISWLIKFKGII